MDPIVYVPSISIFSYVIIYFVVKAAVRNGMKEALGSTDSDKAAKLSKKNS